MLSVVIGVVAVILAVCCFGGVRAFLGVKKAYDEDRAAGHVATQFIEDVQKQRVEAAYGRLCMATKSEYPQEEFAAIVKRERPATGHKIVANLHTNDSQSVFVELRYQDGSTDTHILSLIEEDAEWKVCGSPL